MKKITEVINYNLISSFKIQLHSNRNYIEDIEHKNKLEIIEVEKEFNKNKDKVIDYLFENALQVEIIVPEVIKGNFEERFGVKN